ncbi:MAG: ferredoxin [Streptomycetales bacterium]
MIKLRTDVDKCEGYANCVIASPDVYDIDDDGGVVLLRTEVPEDRRDEVSQAVRSCPTAAIWIEDE